MLSSNAALERKTPALSNDITLAFERLKETSLSTEKNQRLLTHYAKYALDITFILEKLAKIKKELANQFNFNALIQHREFCQDILAALDTTPVTNQEELDRLLYTIDRAMVFEDLSDRPKDYIKSRCPQFFDDDDYDNEFKVNPNLVPTYCYQKLKEAKPNGIAFSLPSKWEREELACWHELFNAWQEQHFLLVVYYTPTHEWNDIIQEKTRDFLKDYVLESKNPDNFPFPLIHSVRVKINIKLEQYEKAIALTKQSSLHLNLFNEEYINAQLSGIQFAYANLTSINLEKANLQNANLKSAILHNASLRGADLRGADLEDAQLHNADLRETLLDEKSALNIVRFIENNPLYVPQEYAPLRQCILDAKETDLVQRAQDCIALIFVINRTGNFHLENFPEAMKDYPVSPAFLQIFLELTAPRAEPPENGNFYVTQINEDCDRYDTYKSFKPVVADEKVLKEKKRKYYCFFNEREIDDAKLEAHSQRMFTKAYTVQSRYLVLEFQHNKKMIWDRKAPDEAPLVSHSYFEEERDPLLPLHRITQKPTNRQQYHSDIILDAASLHSDEVVSLHKEDEKLSLEFFKNDKCVKSQKLDKSSKCASLTSLHPNQFVIAYFDNTIEVWNRTPTENDAMDFSPTSHFFVEPINRPFCPEKIETEVQHQLHRCFKLIRSYDQSTYSFVTKSILLGSPNDASVRALNSEEVLLIQDNYEYQFLVKINIKTQEMTHALEFFKELSSWKTVPHTYYPLADGLTFLVGTYQIGNGYLSGSSLILDAKTMSFYKADGVDFSEETAELAILESSEVLKTTMKRHKRDRETVYIGNAFPHITAYHDARQTYINKQVDGCLQHQFNSGIRGIIVGYLNSHMTLSLKEKSELASNPTVHYGTPVAVFSKLPLECHPHDYFCRGAEMRYIPPDNSLPAIFVPPPESQSVVATTESKPVNIANNPSGLFAAAAARPDNAVVKKELARDCCPCPIL